jgi:predicted porin
VNIPVKKITLAALVLSAFATSAQAQSNVTVYGLVDLGFLKLSGASLIERENHPSRLGFKGSEDLGNGLSAVFNLEMEILADTGLHKGNLFDRQANVGLKGGFGTVLLGRTKNIIDGALGRVEPFGADGYIGKLNESMMRVGVGASRVQNAVTYVSPKFAGSVVVTAQYQASEVKGADAGTNVLVAYDEGNLSAHIGYEKAVQAAVSPADPHMIAMGVGYKFGDLKLTAAYNRGDTDTVANGKYKGWLVGANYKIGNGDAHAVYGKQEQSTTKFSGKDNLKLLGVGYDYHLSKRTDLYTFVGRDGVKDQNSVQAGITHRF